MTKATYPLLAAVLLLASCSDLQKSDDKTTLNDATADTAVVARTGTTPGQVAAGAANALDSAATNTGDAIANAASTTGDAISNAFDLTKEKLTDVRLPEVTVQGLTVRGNQLYQVYDLNEDILFDTDKAVVKPSAAEALNQIGSSITKRFPNKQIRILGFADARGDKSYNKELGKERAEAVKNYLVNTDKLPTDRVTTESFGETVPAATNAKAAGRQKNRRVEVAVRIK